MSCNPRLTFTNRPQRMCILTKRVFDACLQQIARENEQLYVSFQEPPVSFVEVRGNGTCVISNVSITPTNTPGCSRVRFTLTIPLEVVALNEEGNPILGTTSVVVEQDLFMRVPQDSLVPTEIACTTSIQGFNGSLSDSTLTITLCITLIIRIVADVDIVITSCGYVNLPPCSMYSEDICSGVFSLPVYPPTP
ncbi:MAG: hypothetical protein PHI19_07120 [Clostridia bacterium]|nr:hypothetical protein [Clostridia bacterium]